MAISPVWQITYNGVTKSAADWGISQMLRSRKSPINGDKLKFIFRTLPVDGTPPFPCLIGTVAAKDIPTLKLTRVDPVTNISVVWFVGVVTNIDPVGEATGESIGVEVSGPWYWIDNIIFQQQWVTQNLITGSAALTATTTRSNVILSQALTGVVSMNSGQVLNEVLLYAQYAFQMIPYPTTIGSNLLPAPPPTAFPFIIGTITPNITVPYSQVRDKSCGDIIKLLLKYSPDCVVWFDYTTAVPTINIAKRSSLPSRAIQVLTGKVVNKFKPRPRYDLKIPVAVAKFEIKNTVDGETWDNLIVQSYPPAPEGIDQGAWESQPRAWVQTVDLVGSNVTTQTADIVTVERPIIHSDEICMTWILYKEPGLTSLNKDTGAQLWDWQNVGCAFIGTVIDPNDPLTQSPQSENNPNDITFKTPPTPPAVTVPTEPGDCPQLVNELVTGEISSWIQEQDEIDAAKVKVEAWLTYSGTDPATMALFNYDPANPATPRTDGKGYLVRHYNIKATSAATDVYSAVTSVSTGEPVPSGFAQYLYNTLGVLHFEGAIVFKESECSDMLPPGFVFNVTDGDNPAWATMNALVLAVEEDIDKGVTTVTFGPPLSLTLGELADLFRAQLGRLPGWKLDQRQTGKLQSGSNVIGNRHAADTNTAPPLVPYSPNTQVPWFATISLKAGTATVTINPASLLMRTLKQGDNQPVDNLGPTTIPINSTANSTDFIYLEQAVSNYIATGNAKIFSKTSAAGQPNIFDPTLPAWDASNNAYLANGGTSDQTFFRVLLGTIKTGPAQAGVTPAPVYTPCCSQNLLIYYCTIGGLKAINAYQTPSSSIASTP